MELGTKCVVNLKKTIWRIVERFEFNETHKVQLNLNTKPQSLRLKQTPADLEAVSDKLFHKI